jgi:hypothetical protein
MPTFELHMKGGPSETDRRRERLLDGQDVESSFEMVLEIADIPRHRKAKERFASGKESLTAL